jgi:hypothetical protein
MADDVPVPTVELPDEVEAALVRFVEDLDEKNRRRAAGLLALVIGHGGVAAVGRLTGHSHTTIERGRRELAHNDLGPPGRVRAPGGGRKPAGKALASSPRSRP